MPRGTRLTDSEKGAILAHNHHGISQRQIAKLVGRSRDAIKTFLSNPNPTNTTTFNARNQKLSPTAIRRIIRKATTTKKSAKQIKNDLEIDVTTRRVQQILRQAPHLQYRRSIRAPYMMARHKKKRLQWAKEKIEWGAVNWRKVIFSDETKFNLDGPDGLDHYWHDLRTSPEIFSKRQQGRVSLMIWGSISYYGVNDLVGVTTTMNSTNYCKVLEENLLEFAAQNLGENYVFQHDGASIHLSNAMKEWLQDHNLNVLEWPAKRPDLNIIENLWGIVARGVYKDRKHYDNVEDFGEAVIDVWSNIDINVVKNLYKSIPRRLVSVIERKGECTKY